MLQAKIVLLVVNPEQSAAPNVKSGIALNFVRLRIGQATDGAL